MATRSSSGNPLGPFIGTALAKVPPVTPIQGKHVTLTPRHPSHFPSLYDHLGGPENSAIWDYIPNGPFLSSQEFSSALSSHHKLPNRALYTVISNSTGDSIGSLALLNIQPENRSIEIGYVLFSRLLQRTVEGTEVMYLLLRLVFEDLDYRRCEWKCDSLNERSKSAALRLGFKAESVFRQHMVVKGRNRDTAWFAIIDSDWPGLKKGFDRWLGEANFDELGVQKKSLADLRE